MALNNVSLNKLLKLIPRPLKARESIIRGDARDAVLKEKAIGDGDGGDFYGAFWFDAKGFVLRGGDLAKLVKARMQTGKSRRRLYPMLLKGFNQWYANFSGILPSERKEIANAFGKCSRLAPNGDVRVHSLLAWKDPDGSSHLVYPYFDKDYALGARAARLGRWTMASAIKDHDPVSMAVLDVLRGQAYDNDNCPLLGNEEELLSERYERFLSEWETQKRMIRRP